MFLSNVTLILYSQRLCRHAVVVVVVVVVVVFAVAAAAAGAD